MIDLTPKITKTGSLRPFHVTTNLDNLHTRCRASRKSIYRIAFNEEEVGRRARIHHVESQILEARDEELQVVAGNTAWHWMTVTWCWNLKSSAW